ncbi:MAG: Jag N-terminal domain-containing protein [Candidatus Omnitrophota bacterium]
MAKQRQTRVESEGSTVEEAIQKGLSVLKTTRDKVSVKVVCEEQKGLFGMEGAKQAKVIISLNQEKS